MTCIFVEQSHSKGFWMTMLKYGINYSHLIQIVFKKNYLIHKTLTSTTTPGQGRSGSNGNDQIIEIWRQQETWH